MTDEAKQALGIIRQQILSVARQTLVASKDGFNGIEIAQLVFAGTMASSAIVGALRELDGVSATEVITALESTSVIGG